MGDSVLRIDFQTRPIDLSDYETVILTSSNGVTACGEALQGRHVVTVGDKTAEAAAQEGADATALGTDADGLVANADRIKGPALHVRGRYTRGAIVERLGNLGIEVDDLVLYEQVSQPLSQAALALLQGEGQVIAPVFSPRSSKLLSQAPISADVRVIAMSDAVRDAWTGPGKVDVVSAPTSDEMVRQVLSHF